MYFDSLESLLHMDGHGVFVWAAYLITCTVVTLMLLTPRMRARRILRQLAGDVRRQQGRPVPVEEEA